MNNRLVRGSVLGFVLMFVSAAAAYACDCFLHPKFADISHEVLIIRGTVQSHGTKPIDEEHSYPTMLISVEEVIRGEYSYEKVELLGDPGWECLASLDPSVFAVGEEFLFALGSEDFQQGLGGCAETYVNIDAGVIHGEYLRPAKWWR